MVLGQKVLFSGIIILFCFLLVGQAAGPAGEYGAPINSRGRDLLPPELLRPHYGEEPCFPRDYVIGELGRCDASEESYRYAKLITANLVFGNKKTPGVGFSEQKRLSAAQSIGSLGTRSWRVGGGRVEPDGSVSFLIRFLGREQSVTGELYLRKEEPGTRAEEEDTDADTIFWRVDDVLLEKPRSLGEGKYSPGGAEMAAYERFF